MDAEVLMTALATASAARAAQNRVTDDMDRELRELIGLVASRAKWVCDRLCEEFGKQAQDGQGELVEWVRLANVT